MYSVSSNRNKQNGSSSIIQETQSVQKAIMLVVLGVGVGAVQTRKKGECKHIRSKLR